MTALPPYRLKGSWLKDMRIAQCSEGLLTWPAIAEATSAARSGTERINGDSYRLLEFFLMQYKYFDIPSTDAEQSER